MNDDHDPSLLSTIQAIAAGKLVPTAPLHEARARAAALEPWLKAFCHLPAHDEGEAMHAGPLRGIPVGVKDIIATAGMPTTRGSPIFDGFVPETDAAIVATIKAKGGFVFGKTVSTEFAWRHPGPTVNPWNREHTPGGSSSGSAAAVAAGIVPLALGSQTLGSILRPAAYCGVVGFKPSKGAIPLDGAFPLSPSLDHLGFMTRSVADAAAAFAVLVEGKGEVVVSEAAWNGAFTPLPSPRLAVLRTDGWQRASEEQRRNFDAALGRLRAGGAELREIECPIGLEEIFERTLQVLAYEAARENGAMIAANAALASESYRTLMRDGAAIGEETYRAALALRPRLTETLARLAEGCDATIGLATTGTAPAGLGFTGDAVFCATCSLTGAPAIAVPSGWSAAGLPFGVQLWTAPGQDQALLRVAAWAQAQLGHQRRRVANGLAAR